MSCLTFGWSRGKGKNALTRMEWTRDRYIVEIAEYVHTLQEEDDVVVAADPAGPPYCTACQVPMTASPGTPVGGDRAPRSPRRAAASDDASASGPMEVEAGASAAAKIFCPVSGCPSADRLRARGWASAATVQAHIDAHLAGSLQGDVLAAWLQTHGRQQCPACGLSVSTRHAIHPTC